MRLTQEDQAKADAEYADAFNRDMQPTALADDQGTAAPKPMPESTDGDLTDGAASVSVTPEADQQAEAEPATQAPDQPMPDQAAEADVESQPAEGAPMTEQQLRSWEGRLRKQQQELDMLKEQARPAAAPAVIAIELGDEPAEGEAEGDAAKPGRGDDERGDEAIEVESAGQAAEGGSESQMSVAEARQRVTDDFGPDFLRVIEAIARDAAREHASAQASDAVKGVGSRIESLINEVNEALASLHFDRIAQAHEDFLDVVQQPQFQQWIKEQDRGTAQRYHQIIASGNASQVIKLLNAYKDSLAKRDGQGAEVDDDAIDAAAGVRSGIALPKDVPAAPDDDYARAWLNG